MTKGDNNLDLYFIWILQRLIGQLKKSHDRIICINNECYITHTTVTTVAKYDQRNIGKPGKNKNVSLGGGDGIFGGHKDQSR